MVLFFLLTICLLFPIDYALGKRDSGDMEKQLLFADSLFEDKDFYRAITEYKRFIFFYPEARMMCEKAYFKIGISYYAAKRYEESIEALTTFIGKYPESSFLIDALYHKGLAEKALKQYDRSVSTFQHIIDTDKGEYRNKAVYQQALIYIDQENWVNARQSFSHIPEGSALYPSASVFLQGIDNIDNIPYKSPAVAGTLAAILPGSGHLYTERPRDALVAFLLNGAFILAAVELFNDDEYVTGGIVTFFELGWYSGNIYSAVNCAHKYNKRMKKDFIQGLRDRTSVSIRYNPDNTGKYLALTMRF
jgi:tetratricopeptide (TPR) repeat protein